MMDNTNSYQIFTPEKNKSDVYDQIKCKCIEDNTVNLLPNDLCDNITRRCYQKE